MRSNTIKTIVLGLTLVVASATLVDKVSYASPLITRGQGVLDEEDAFRPQIPSATNAERVSIAPGGYDFLSLENE
jgi:hypothetical protein